ncbi:ABC transporter ATP-binding protein [Ligaoa zhengdingensis]
MEHLITMRGINKSYAMGQERLLVLKDINLTVEKGEFLAILGPSGSGKSTLMNIIGCMDNFDSGEYILDGNAIQTMKDSQLTKIRNREIGFIFQRYQLIPSYNVLQNVMIPLIIRGYTRREAMPICRESLRSVGLDERRHHKPNELSGGQQQRVAIARALIGNPNILLADEPTGALDTATGSEVLELFQQLNEQGHTIIMITHDLNVASHAKRVVRIVDGQLFTQ